MNKHWMKVIVNIFKAAGQGARDAAHGTFRFLGGLTGLAQPRTAPHKAKKGTKVSRDQAGRFAKRG